ncbi:activator of basal transcription 1 [Narcine bancroftii]|uniref:activator of basal transcription 1 n=1 Tax=Narcine bancroftii TaxID=1343680 RepID=UPI0038318502
MRVGLMATMEASSQDGPAGLDAEPASGRPAGQDAEPASGRPAGQDAEPASGRPVKAAALRRPEPGVIYLGFIPKGMDLSLLRKLMSTFGVVGRIFLRPTNEKKTLKRSKKKFGNLGKSFREGWVEFENKALAKRVARSLHNTPIATKKRKSFSDDLWNMKYLHRFKWIHLNERLAYERLVRKQKLRVEVSQAKRETDFFLQNLEKSKNIEKVKEIKRKKGQKWQEKNWHFRQRDTEAEIQASKAAASRQAAGNSKMLGKMADFHRKSQTNASLLTKIFKTKQ